VTPALRPMVLADLAAVLAVERAAYFSPWAESHFRDSLRQDHECWVLGAGDAVLGHGILSAVAHEGELLNLCIAPEAQGRGLGAHLLSHLLDRARARQCDEVFLEVRDSNGAARRLYRRAGFQEIGRRRGYYPGPEGAEDARVLRRELA
jgi:ribosomal-protein-alanine N-acetyltransferase